MTAAAGQIRTSWMSTAAGPPKSDRKKVNNSIEKRDTAPATAAGTHN
jgi:hypothetical protein